MGGVLLAAVLDMDWEGKECKFPGDDEAEGKWRGVELDN